MRYRVVENHQTKFLRSVVFYIAHKHQKQIIKHTGYYSDDPAGEGVWGFVWRLRRHTNPPIPLQAEKLHIQDVPKQGVLQRVPDGFLRHRLESQNLNKHPYCSF